ncbi:FAD-dependent oxidoreductase [Asanoa sp. WMMD1127]|uniref:FAD-dependent oxidoreductase n=1 Tax=Asanoa sp. WMMD1127 TaxID=3016107 RepID=UPI002415EB75|nr:FAD-dependent oxidoreductase [Asanoa sp. WMMD1127]MDG4825830.1 FAD-dependent oxidoreductase [Asanoa sp. WMMD1127]
MTRIENAKILVCGAGIAGTALAWWLAERGARVTVVERAESPRDGGYKVDIRGAALAVVERMGLLESVRAHRTGVRTGSVVDATGRRVASMDADTFGGRVHDDAELLRGDLARLLREGASGVDFRFGDAVAGVSAGGEVTFESGQRTAYDLVVGADGLRSRTRELAFGGGGVHDLGHYVAIWSVPNHLGLDREELTYVGPGRTALVYSTAGQADAKAMCLFTDPGGPRPSGRAAQHAFLTSAYAGEGWEVPRLLDALPGATDFYFDTVSQARLDSWSRGRVTLIGDAAYCASPASGQGTSLALVGAYVLAGELAAAGLDQGPARYERLMRPFVAANQKLGPANIKRMVLRSRGQVRMSMRMLAVVNRLPGKERMLAKVVEPIHRAATAIDLPSY